MVADAVRGRLPTWACAEPARRHHMRRVAELMGTWARARGRDPDEVERWRAAGLLHDVLRDAPPADLLPLLNPGQRNFPEAFMHAPAAASRLRDEGVADESLLRAVAYHPLGHPEFDELGRALYMADFLEPGRPFDREERARLRDRAPTDPDGVLREVARRRIERVLREGHPLYRETIEFWNRIVEGECDG